MKNLITLVVLALATSSAQASFVSNAYKLNVDKQTRSAIKSAVQDLEQYSSQQESAAGFAIRGHALNVLNHSFKQFDQEVATSTLAQDVVSASSEQLTTARAHLKTLITIHNQGSKVSRAKLVKAAAAVKADFAVLEE